MPRDVLSKITDGPRNVFLDCKHFKFYDVNAYKAPWYKVEDARATEHFDMLPLRTCKKIKQDYELIEKTILVVNETFERLGFPLNFHFDPEHVLFTNNRYVQRVRQHNEDGIFQMDKMSSYHKIIGGLIVCSNDTRKHRVLLLHHLIHELMHHASINYGFLTKSDNEWDGTWIQTLDNCLILKSGYYTHYERYDEYCDILTSSSKLLFCGFNEAITEELVRESVRLTFPKYFPETYASNFLEKWDDIYSNERQMLYHIILHVSEMSNKTVSEVWCEFVKHYLDGSLMFLRSIDRYYGKGSLRLLAHMISPEYAPTPEEFLKAKKQNENLIKYFSEKDAGKRERMIETFQLRNRYAN